MILVAAFVRARPNDGAERLAARVATEEGFRKDDEVGSFRSGGKGYAAKEREGFLERGSGAILGDGESEGRHREWVDVIGGQGGEVYRYQWELWKKL